MKSKKLCKVFLVFLFITTDAFSQPGESPIRIFGYFQTSFNFQDEGQFRTNRSSFSVQQLNMMFQKDLAKNWTSFINLEFINSFSSGRQWGQFNLEEAWIRYRLGKRLNIKAGLQIPIFNNLNEISNKTPILPYIIRPIAYETSFSDFINIEDFIPKRTFLQAYGFFDIDNMKLDYALYVGNSPNINNNKTLGQTGVDTTDTFLIGGRVGIRYVDLKAGISATYDRVRNFAIYDVPLGLPETKLDDLKRIRLGGDLSYNHDKFSFEFEVINVTFDDDSPLVDLDKEFYYATISYNFTEEILGFISYWKTKEYLTGNGVDIFKESFVEMDIPNFGITYDFNSRIRIKTQYARGRIAFVNNKTKTFRTNFYSAAVSVFF